MIRRGSIQDVYVEGAAAAIFIDEQVVVLSEIATAVLLAVPPDEPIGIQTIATHLVEQFGQPPDGSAAEIAGRLVADLVEHKILVQT